MSKRLRAVVPVKRIAPPLFILLVLPFFADAQLLSRKVDLKVVDKPLLEIIRQLESDLQVQFAFNSSIIPRNHLLSVDLIALPLDEVLDYLLGGLDIGYREMNGQLVLYKQAQPRPRSDLPSVENHVKGTVLKKGTTPVDKKTSSVIKLEENANEVADSIRIETANQDSVPLYTERVDSKLEIDSLLEEIDTLSFVIDTQSVFINDTANLLDSLRKEDTLVCSSGKGSRMNSLRFLYSNYYIISSKVGNNAGENGEVFIGEEKAWDVLASSSLRIMFKRGLGHFYVMGGLQLAQIKDQNRFKSDGEIERIEKEVVTTEIVDKIIPVVVGSELKIESYHIIEPASSKLVLQEVRLYVPLYRYDTVKVEEQVTATEVVDDTVRPPIDLELTRVRSFFTLPVSVGYEHHLSDKIYLGFNTGLEVSWLVRYVEESFNGSRYAFVEDYNKVVFDVAASAEVGYCFNTDFSAVLVCDVKTQTNSTYVDDFRVSRKNSSLGFKLGLQYAF